MDKKVLYISYNGLLESILPSQTVPYLKILSKNGFKFILLTFEKKKDLKECGRERLKNTKDSLKKEGITWRWLTYHKYPNNLSTFLDIFIGFFVSMYLVIKNRINMVHVRGATPGTIGLFLSKIFKIKLLFDTRGILAEEYVGGGLWKEETFFFNLVKSIEKELMNRADAIVVLTEKHRKKILNLPYLKRKAIPKVVIPCCVDLKRFRCDTSNHKELLKKYDIDADMLLVYPGKLGTFYLLKEMVDFFESVSSEIEGLKFLILTQDDISEAKYVNIARKEGIYLIRPSFDEIPFFLRCADAGIFFINSYKKYGSSPIKLGEFLACGKPVIINPGIGDTEEIVTNNRVGVVVRDFNKDEYLNKITELLKLLKEGKQLESRCRMTAERFLSLRMGAERYEKIYRELTK